MKNIEYLQTILISKTKGRRIFLLLMDITILFLSYWLTFSIKFNGYENYSNLDLSIFYRLVLPNIIFAILFYISTNQYKALTRFTNSSILYKIGIRNIFIFLIFIISNIFFYKSYLPLINIIFLCFISTTLMSYSRAFIKLLIFKSFNYQKGKKLSKVGIYGAGTAANILATTISTDKNIEIIGFFDDNPTLWGRSIYGKNIYSSNDLNKFKDDIDYIILAILSIEQKTKHKIINKIKSLNIPIFQLPSINDLKNFDPKKIDKLNIEFDQLLGREPVKPDENLLKKSIFQKVCCVSGAGGSIGRELAKQILELSPKELILIDSNEYALYSIKKEIDDSLNLLVKEIKIVTILGNLTTQNFAQTIFNNHKIDVVFHAAAYKHVPLVESNPITGIYNNVISTKVICEESFKANIEKFIYISTDKAVRPSNVMGASKRLGEIIIQSFAKLTNESDSNTTNFSIVRFGNVLGSSGSVIPLFKDQINKGGPVTVTHNEVIRYFMTIKEAVSLVLQASSLSLGGEVFILDMGKPVKIIDLAKQLIKLSGLTIKDKINPKGDIAIKVVGLRKGEKLYEELLINGKAEKTSHPLIFKAKEKLIPHEKLIPLLDKLEKHLKMHDKKQVFNLLKFLVPEWSSQN